LWPKNFNQNTHAFSCFSSPGKHKSAQSKQIHLHKKYYTHFTHTHFAHTHFTRTLNDGTEGEITMICLLTMSCPPTMSSHPYPHLNTTSYAVIYQATGPRWKLHTAWLSTPHPHLDSVPWVVICQEKKWGDLTDFLPPYCLITVYLSN